MKFLILLCALSNFAQAQNSVEDAHFLEMTKDSAINLLIEASAKYRAGTISKEKYIEAALNVSDTADYSNKNREIYTTGTSVSAPSNMPTMKEYDPTVKSNSKNTITASEVAAAAAQNAAKTVLESGTNKVISCSAAAEKDGCKVGLYKGTLGKGGYYSIKDPVVTVSKEHNYTVAGESITFNWTVTADEAVNCELKDAYDNSVIKSGFGIGSGTWTTPKIQKINRSPAATYMVMCKYVSGQLSYKLVNVYHVEAGSPWLLK